MAISPRRFLNVWKHRALELAHKLRPAHRSPFPRSWPFHPARARTLTLHWPRRYHCPGAHKWVGHLLQGLRGLVRVSRAAIEQPFETLVTAELECHGRRHVISIDYSDYKNVIAEPGLRDSFLYFKMQYREAGYGCDRIVRGGFFNPAGDYYRYLRELRALRERGDAAASYDVYGRFSLEFAADVRRRAVEILEAQRQFRYEGSLDLVRYSQFLREAARARICIDLPGNGDFCFRLLDYLGMGGFIIAVRHGTQLPVPLEDRKHIVYVKDDLSDLVDLCRHYLDRPQERKAVADNARDYFDRYLHRDQLAGYYLSTWLDRLPAG